MSATEPTLQTSKQPQKHMNTLNREAIQEGANPLGMEGIEFIEYATSKPQALGQVLEAMGFKPIARHRSREVLLYRQGELNIVVNAHPPVAQGASRSNEAPSISAIPARRPCLR